MPANRRAESVRGIRLATHHFWFRPLRAPADKEIKRGRKGRLAPSKAAGLGHEMTDEQPERMSTNVTRVEFDSTLDEVVDANMRLVQHTATYRKQRMHYQWFVGVSVAGGEAVAILSTRNEVTSYATL